MENTMEACSVVFSGPSFALLCYETMNAGRDQEGFLLGEVTTKVTDNNISDSQLNFTKKEIIVNVGGVVSCDTPFSFYDGQGRVNEDALRNILDCRWEDVIGWYRFRRNSTLKPFVRERTVHDNLRRLLPRSRQAFFFLSLLTADTTENAATHTIDYAFFCFNRTTQCLPATISCLDATSLSEYRTMSSSTVEKRNELYGRYLKESDILMSSESSSSLGQINGLHSSLQISLQKLCNLVSSSENEVAKLLDDIRNIQSELEDTLLVKGMEGCDLSSPP